MTGKMHAGEVDITADLVRDLVARQFPDLAGRPVIAVQPTGTVNAIFRLWPDLCARLPRTPAWAAGLLRERRWLGRLAPHLPLQVPAPVATGAPAPRYPLPWAIYRWLPGQPYSDGLACDELQAAADLAAFILALRGIDPAGAPATGRRPLAELDAVTRAAIESAGGLIDRGAALAAWQRALRAPRWDGTRTWIHADLLRPNLLVDGGRLSAVIDFGAAGAGDPATDVIAAWAVFGPAGRARFRELLGVEDGCWERARGIALHQAALIVPYYAKTNPAFTELARRTIDQVVRA